MAMHAATYTVQGMTCEHCVRAVTEELSKLDGVQRVDVDLARGSVTVLADHPLDGDTVRAAVDEAGYRLVVPGDGEGRTEGEGGRQGQSGRR